MVNFYKITHPRLIDPISPHYKTIIIVLMPNCFLTKKNSSGSLKFLEILGTVENEIYFKSHKPSSLTLNGLY